MVSVFAYCTVRFVVVTVFIVQTAPGASENFCQMSQRPLPELLPFGSLVETCTAYLYLVSAIAVVYLLWSTAIRRDIRADFSGVKRGMVWFNHAFL